MENNEIQAQANLIHPNSLGDLRIGDSPIHWYADLGDPSSSSGGNLYGNAFYADANTGVILTETTTSSYGYLYWQKDYDYTKNIYMRATTYSGEGSGADGITFYMGTNTQQVHAANTAGGIGVYADEYNDDVIKVYFDGVLKNTFNTFDTLDNGTHRLWELVYEYVSGMESYLSVYMNNKMICRTPIDGAIPTGNYVGVSGWCGGQTNYHICRAFSVMSANPWLKING